MKKYFIILGIIQLIIAIGAIPAGFYFVFNPDGNASGPSTDMLRNSPFPDFLVPGLFLFIVHGLGNLSGSVLSFLKKKTAALAGIILGVLLVGWIVLQVYWIGLSSFLQPLFFVVGLVEVGLGFYIRTNPKSVP